MDGELNEEVDLDGPEFEQSCRDFRRQIEPLLRDDYWAPLVESVLEEMPAPRIP